jgi:hypothetical protein
MRNSVIIESNIEDMHAVFVKFYKITHEILSTKTNSKQAKSEGSNLIEL